MKASPDFQKTGDPAFDLYFPLRWRRDPGENFKQCRLACAVFTDDAEDFALLHFEVDVPEGPKSVVSFASSHSA